MKPKPDIKLVIATAGLRRARKLRNYNMKRFYLFLLSGLLALTQFTAVAQLQMGFHYKIMNKYDAATSIRYKVIYSTIATPTPAATTTTTTFSVPATAAIPRTHTTPAVPAIATTTITTTTITPAVIPAVAPSITTTITNIQKYPIKKLNAGIKQKGDSLIIGLFFQVVTQLLGI